jgi:hypothetical protein
MTLTPDSLEQGPSAGAVEATRGVAATLRAWRRSKAGSAATTLAQRGRISASTFRLTLAAALVQALQLKVDGSKRLSPESEHHLSDWMCAHLEVAVHPFADADALADLEHHVLAALDPPLNLDGMPRKPLRENLSRFRAKLSRGDAVGCGERRD